jgi:hypothetical protein
MPAKPFAEETVTDMTVLARTKLGASRIGRHREGRPGRAAGRGEAPGSPNPTLSTPPRGAITAARRRREAGAPQDQAVYSCHCGFVFEAQVSTSVDCPHCGGTQAW